MVQCRHFIEDYFFDQCEKWQKLVNFEALAISSEEVLCADDFTSCNILMCCVDVFNHSFYGLFGCQ